MDVSNQGTREKNVDDVLKEYGFTDISKSPCDEGYQITRLHRALMAAQVLLRQKWQDVEREPIRKLKCGCFGECIGHPDEGSGPGYDDHEAHVEAAREFYEPIEGTKEIEPGGPLDVKTMEDKLRGAYIAPLRDREHMRSLGVQEDNWQHRSAEMRCRTCTFYVPKVVGIAGSESGAEIGRCRHSAPTSQGWPAIYPSDWCGQHKIDESKI